MQAVLSFKEMLCVQSKQKDMEYQRSFIKQLMDLYSLEKLILGWENPTEYTQTYQDVLPMAFLYKSEPRRTQNRHVADEESMWLMTRGSGVVVWTPQETTG